MIEAIGYIAAQASEPNGGLFVMPDAFMITYRGEVTSLAARYRLPAVYGFRFFADLGGLLSYGEDLTDNFRRAATYADRILKGEKPSELPVQGPVKFELVINRKTAKALGLTIPLSFTRHCRRGDRISWPSIAIFWVRFCAAVEVIADVTRTSFGSITISQSQNKKQRKRPEPTRHEKGNCVKMCGSCRGEEKFGCNSV
jgi:hypothetical protein